MDRKENFGNSLKSLRKAKRLSQIDLAKKIEVSQNVISKYEQGETFPTFEVLIRLAEALNVSLDDLVFEATPEAKNIVEENKELVKAILSEMSLEEIIDKFDIKIDGTKPTIEETKKAINLIRFEWHNRSESSI